MLNNIATHILLTEKPVKSLSTRSIIKALTISRNKPKVTTVMGNVRIIKIGLTNKFKTDSTIATRMAVANLLPDNSTPGSK